jgi:di/tricarboxylate transporter
MPDFEPAVVLATLIACLVLFVTDALRYELVALLAVVALAVTGCLTTEQAFAGFGAPATVTVASMYVFAEAVTRWGVAQAIGQRLILSRPRSEAWVALI